MKKKILALALVVVFALMTGLAGCSGSKTEEKKDNAGKQSSESKSGKEITLNAVTAWPSKINMNDGFHYLAKEVNATGKGKVQIKYLGGPEVIPSGELVNAVKNGSVDIAWIPATYAVSLVPEANAFELTKYTPEQERTNGFYDLYNEIFQKKANAIYLGRGTPGLNFNLYSNVPIKTLGDFKGKPFRATPSYKELVRSLGASPVAIDPGEVYTALERAVVVGYGWPQIGISDYGWEAKTKYIIEPGFYQVDVLALVNKDKWNSLNEEQKEVLKKSTAAMEKAMQQHFAEVKAKERQLLVSKGLQVVELSPDDSKKYLQLAFDGVMNTVLKASPEYGAKIKDILTK